MKISQTADCVRKLDVTGKWLWQASGCDRQVAVCWTLSCNKARSCLTTNRVKLIFLDHETFINHSSFFSVFILSLFISQFPRVCWPSLLSVYSLTFFLSTLPLYLSLSSLTYEFYFNFFLKIKVENREEEKTPKTMNRYSKCHKPRNAS